MKEIDNIELLFLSLDDYEELKEVMQEVYDNMESSYWRKQQIQSLINIFPEGQVVIKADGQIAACALSLKVQSKRFEKKHTFREVTGLSSFNTHDPEGDILYGIDVFVKPEFRGLRLGRRLYDYRKELCEQLNLKGILFGGRIPNYHRYSDQMSAKEYIRQVRERSIHDPVLDFQLSNDFHPVRILKNYLAGDQDSEENAVLLKWDNIYYEEPVDVEAVSPVVVKRYARLGLIQWQMRPYKDIEELMQQAEFFIDAVSGYRADFALFPEFFNAPLMAAFNHLDEAQAIRKLACFTQDIVKKFSEFSISFNINIITGSMPEVVDDKLYNVGYLCKRDGSVERYEKIHVTPDEAKVWGMVGGHELKTFDTDCGKIGILICYDSEFPELSRILADEGMNILFVPFLTDTQNGFSRLKNCSQARAIENECYVAIAGSVGNLPKVHNMDIQYAQSMVFTPCDFAFPVNGIKAEATPNTEMILIADVDFDLLNELHNNGSVRNLIDRRKDIYELKRSSGSK